jgi:hypothetical protein
MAQTLMLGAVVIGLVVGWLLGMWTRKRSNQWCPVDGAKLTCPRCMTAGAHSLGRTANLARRASFVDGGDLA